MLHGFQRLRFEYAALAYSPGHLYQFKLEPVDVEWSQPAAQPFTDFTNLTERDYTFRVRTVGGDGRVSPEATLKFTVLPPWYRTRWAYLLWVACIAGLVMIYTRIHNRNLQRHAEELLGLVSERTEQLQHRVEELRDTQHQLLRQNDLLDHANRSLEELSLADALTGIANRRFFDKSLEEEWRRARRTALPLALVMLDIDHFKDLNDQHGHPAGDAWLRAVALHLRESVHRTGDVVARYGGEEFAVLLPNTSAEGTILVAEQLRRGIETLRVEEAGGVGVTASFGVASLVPSSDEASNLVQLADDALYTAKRDGRNRIAVSAADTGIQGVGRG